MVCLKNGGLCGPVGYKAMTFYGEFSSFRIGKSSEKKIGLTDYLMNEGAKQRETSVVQDKLFSHNFCS